MLIAIPKEILTHEQRVALTPSLVPELVKLGCTVGMEKNAGLAANFPDNAYQQVEFYEDAATLYAKADIILKVQPPNADEVRHFKNGAVLISFIFPDRNPETVASLQYQKVICFAIERLPRISRAQSMDALSSQATVAGYKAALIAATQAKRFFPMLTTAAGTLRPSQVLVIGAGVAGLQAIATARRLGAVVTAYDIRSATREQVESLGAKMIALAIQAEASGGYARELGSDELEQQQMALTAALQKMDAVIATASVPGKPAPKIITQAMVEQMPRGAIIVDAAAESGGNCELTVPGEVTTHAGVTIYGYTNLASQLAQDASQMYARNLVNFVKLIVKDGELAMDWQDAILAESRLSR